MKFNKWTLGLAALGVVSLASVVQAEEKTSPVMTALSQTTISGYVDTSFVWRMGGNGNQFAGKNLGTGGPGAPAPAFGGAPGPLVPGSGLMVGKQNGFNLNVVGLTLAKPLDEAEWAAGYQVDLLMGPDSVGWNPSPGAFGSDLGIKQAYVQLRAPIGNGLTFKIGTFNEILGYESFESYKNPNYTRSYGWTIEPTQQTGMLASYKINDIVEVSAGIANTTVAGINARPLRGGSTAAQPTSDWEKTYMGSIALTAPESFGFLKGSQLYFGVINGMGQNFGAAWNSDTTWLYAGAYLNTPIEALKVGAAYDYVLTGSQKPGNQSTYALAASGYVTYQAMEKLKLSVRGEYAQGTDGTWYVTGKAAGLLESDPKNMLMASTFTVDYSLWANVISRLEFRWDRDLTDQHQTAPGYRGGPFGNDDRNNLMVALNVIYKF